ncbi:glycerol-3-phosphate dehydrogenase [Anaeramoeba flamelloides]|uniref:Glycerol-3-phosphate dehydrogenase [NAD(+)] n=1 Tax=Anaeramoeba flamelloides TaxID=1746091 RepID=A0ABQ8XF12_9EUKA|nr:glycerol-3-phosphate dehydrogenase [Anaeramoeba flamelloides]
MNSKFLKIGALSALVGLTGFGMYKYLNSESLPKAPFQPIEDEIKPPKKQEKVTLIGSGNWGTACAKIVAENCAKNPEFFEREVRIWVFEEIVEGQKLTEIMNTRHENVKYLPGHKLPDNLVADPDIVSAVKDATLLIFNFPHQFVSQTLEDIQGKVAKGARAITLVKGVNFIEKKHVLVSEMISQELGIEVCSLMGANVANEVAQGQFCETTIGYKNLQTGLILWKLFKTPNFHVRIVNDVKGVEICGALKNIVALGAGFCDGVKSFGGNTKAAIMRVGLMEMKLFAQTFYSSVQTETFFESCGVGDIITTCYGGRNRRCAEVYVRTRKSWQQIEEEQLNGQKLQGVGTSIEVYEILKNANLLYQFPLFHTIYLIVQGELEPDEIVRYDEIC